MPSLTSLLPLLSLLSSTLIHAAPEPLITLAARLPQTASESDSEPAGTTQNFNGNDSNGGQSCPGVLVATGNGGSQSSYCCVGGTLLLSTCPGWPICQGPATTTTPEGGPSCAAKIDVSATDYSAAVSSASASFYGGGGGASSGSASASEGASGSSGSSGAAETASSVSASAASAGSSAASSASAAASSAKGGAAAAMATDGAVLKMGVVGAGLLGLAALL